MNATTHSAATLKAGDKFVSLATGAPFTIVSDPEPGKNGWLLRVAVPNMTGHDATRGHQVWYTDQIHGERVA